MICRRVFLIHILAHRCFLSIYFCIIFCTKQQFERPEFMVNSMIEFVLRAVDYVDVLLVLLRHIS